MYRKHKHMFYTQFPTCPSRRHIHSQRTMSWLNFQVLVGLCQLPQIQIVDEVDWENKMNFYFTNFFAHFKVVIIITFHSLFFKSSKYASTVFEGILEFHLTWKQVKVAGDLVWWILWWKIDLGVTFDQKMESK